SVYALEPGNFQDAPACRRRGLNDQETLPVGREPSTAADERVNGSAIEIVGLFQADHHGAGVALAGRAQAVVELADVGQIDLPVDRHYRNAVNDLELHYFFL